MPPLKVNHRHLHGIEWLACGFLHHQHQSSHIYYNTVCNSKSRRGFCEIHLAILGADARNLELLSICNRFFKNDAMQRNIDAVSLSWSLEVELLACMSWINVSLGFDRNCTSWTWRLSWLVWIEVVQDLHRCPLSAFCNCSPSPSITDPEWAAQTSCSKDQIYVIQLLPKQISTHLSQCQSIKPWLTCRSNCCWISSR